MSNLSSFRKWKERPAGSLQYDKVSGRWFMLSKRCACIVLGAEPKNGDIAFDDNDEMYEVCVNNLESRGFRCSKCDARSACSRKNTNAECALGVIWRKASNYSVIRGEKEQSLNIPEPPEGWEWDMSTATIMLGYKTLTDPNTCVLQVQAKKIQ